MHRSAARELPAPGLCSLDARLVSLRMSVRRDTAKDLDRLRAIVSAPRLLSQSRPSHYAFHGFNTCTRVVAKSLTLRETTVKLW